MFNNTLIYVNLNRKYEVVLFPSNLEVLKHRPSEKQSTRKHDSFSKKKKMIQNDF